jgi:ethanolamine utilization protein EutA (predicted chaperonin)
MRNVPIILFMADGGDDVESLSERVSDRIEMYDAATLTGGSVLGFHLHGVPNHEFLRTVVDAVMRVWGGLDGEYLFALVFEINISMNAGKLATERVYAPVVVIDEIELEQFGYVDIGTQLENTNAGLVTVKSLIFEGEPVITEFRSTTVM